MVESILDLLPGTTRIAVVVGDSPLERFWRVQAEREFAVFAGRVEFLWLDRLLLAAMCREVAALPAKSAVLFGLLNVDAAGVVHEEHEGLAAIRSASSAPVFGLFESELGRGIVGGPLVDIERGEGRRSAAVALAILGGEAPSRGPWARSSLCATSTTGGSCADGESTSGGSRRAAEVRYRPPSLWEAYRRPVLLGPPCSPSRPLLIRRCSRSGRGGGARRNASGLSTAASSRPRRTSARRSPASCTTT